MAKQDFLDNIRVARNLFAHRPVEGANGHAGAGATARSALWLTPRSVKGFDAVDFPELGLDRQRQLQEAVEAFLAVANQVRADEPATEEQTANAAVPFAEIRRILEPYLPTHEEGKRVAQSAQ